MNLQLTPASHELLEYQLALNGNFSICFQTPDARQRVPATLKIQRSDSQVQLELRAMGTTNTCTLPLGQAISTLHRSANQFLEDTANGRGLGVAA